MSLLCLLIYFSLNPLPGSPDSTIHIPNHLFTPPPTGETRWAELSSLRLSFPPLAAQKMQTGLKVRGRMRGRGSRLSLALEN